VKITTTGTSTTVAQFYLPTLLAQHPDIFAREECSFFILQSLHQMGSKDESKVEFFGKKQYGEDIIALINKAVQNLQNDCPTPVALIVFSQIVIKLFLNQSIDSIKQDCFNLLVQMMSKASRWIAVLQAKIGKSAGEKATADLSSEAMKAALAGIACFDFEDAE
jgi:hypothetical protein